MFLLRFETLVASTVASHQTTNEAKDLFSRLRLLKVRLGLGALHRRWVVRDEILRRWGQDDVHGVRDPSADAKSYEDARLVESVASEIPDLPVRELPDVRELAAREALVIIKQ